MQWLNCNEKIDKNRFTPLIHRISVLVVLISLSWAIAISQPLSFGINSRTRKH
ncbi:MAG: hypothetical protein AAGA75_09730 [Cyanobacteria bacterium P01_E01_bin.6]